MKLLDKSLQRELVQSFEDGEIIFRDGDVSQEMYIVQKGAVKIVKEVNGRETVIARRFRGEFIGEMALLESLPRSATALADGKTSLVVINSGGFLQKIRRDPTFAVEMMQRLSKRFRDINQQLLDAMAAAEKGENPFPDMAANAESKSADLVDGKETSPR